MLDRLRKEFIAITMTLIGIVLAVALGSTFVSNYTTQHDLTTSMLERAISGQNYEFRMGEMSGEQSFSEVILVEISQNGTVLAMTSTSYMDIDNEALADVIEVALASDEDSGLDATYSIAWMKLETVVGYRLALCDTYARDSALRKQLVTIIVVFVISVLALYVVVRTLATWILRPVEAAWDRQRRFVSDASHELKTPLAVIVANTQILQADTSIPQGSKRWVDSTAEEASHMKGLVEDLLTLARADEEKAAGSDGPRVRETVNFSEVVDENVLEFDAVAFERGCMIDSSIEPNVTVEGDRDQLARAVRTLIDNATKYAKKGSTVQVKLDRDGKHARLVVNNESDPIDPEDLEHLFDRFYRTDKARERQEQGGFGLGLAIAKSIVESHGGKISATSAEAEGTTFTVVI